METGDLKATNNVDDSIYNSEEEEEEEEEDIPDEIENEMVMDFALLDTDFEEFPSRGSSTLQEYPRNWKRREDMCIGDILRDEALCFLPAKALFRFKSVCRDWRDWIANPFLGHMQSVSFRDVSGLFVQVPERPPSFVSLDPAACGVPNQSLGFIPGGPVTVRATTNGLLCCSGPFDDITGRSKYFVCNPASKEWRVLPPPEYYHGPASTSALALAFEPSALGFGPKFHLVCAFPVPGPPFTFFEVYSSETGSWRPSEPVCGEVDGRDLAGDGVFFGGSVFWETDSGGVLAYDTRNDEFGTFSLPLGRVGFRGCLAAVDGELCYVRPSKEEDEDGRLRFFVEVFGDCFRRLKRKFRIELGVLWLRGGVEVRALGFANDDLLLLVVGRKLCGCHVRDGKVEVISTGFASMNNVGDVKFLPYVNSLVSVA